MATISVCMIVKNEEQDLARCLSCLSDIADEIIVVDTGSTDKTKEIAGEFTDKIYDFEWVSDFSKARNFAFSKATMDYIYSADADEYIDEENRRSLLALKENILPEIEIVQMHYSEKGEISTVLNTESELRPKLYKRLREFTWIDPVHETVRTLPVVFDSDIVIEHHPRGLHAGRDFLAIEKAYEMEGTLSKNLYSMYAREVYRWGEAADLKRASMIFKEVMESTVISDNLFIQFSLVCAKSALVSKDNVEFVKFSSKILALGSCSEICNLLGDYFTENGDKSEADLWYYNAKNETEPAMVEE